MPANEKTIFEMFIAHENLRKLRVSLDALLGNPVWWVYGRPNGNPKTFARLIHNSYNIWQDPRIHGFKETGAIFRMLKKRSKDVRSYLFKTNSRMLHFCTPLVAGDKTIGYFGLSGIHPSARPEILNLAATHALSVLETCAKSEELGRLSATIRPRAIALSTVHTVHRIINSTLNLDELVSRLAHLTAQVLRAGRCAIYLLEKKTQLICKGRAGTARHSSLPVIRLGASLVEAHCAKNAKIYLRKNLLCVPLIDEDVIGVIHVSQKKDKKPFNTFDQEILTTLAEEAVIAIKNARAYEEQRKVTLGSIQSLAVILGTRIPNVIAPEIFLRISLKIAESMRLGDEEMQALHYATLLKDTAKIGIPDEILKKPSKLTGEEYKILREHPIQGAKIVQSFESLKPVVPIILYSREKYDGTGYPKGLKGDKIPVGARILSVINAFEAIIVGRPYRGRASVEEALEEIMRNRGTQFDPKIVDVFIKVIQKESFSKFFKK